MVDNQRAILQSISDDLRCSLPLEAMFPSEIMAIQKVCSFLVVFCVIIILIKFLAPLEFHFALQTQQNPKPTVHVDAFLYDDETVDSLCEEGKMSRNFCLSCGSHRTAAMGNVSHFYIYFYIYSFRKPFYPRQVKKLENASTFKLDANVFMQVAICCSLQCPAEFISHSFSISELQFLFLHVLPDLAGKLVVDVGSRLGAVLYGVIFII